MPLGKKTKEEIEAEIKAEKARAEAALAKLEGSELRAERAKADAALGQLERAARKRETEAFGAKLDKPLPLPPVAWEDLTDPEKERADWRRNYQDKQDRLAERAGMESATRGKALALELAKTREKYPRPSGLAEAMSMLIPPLAMGTGKKTRKAKAEEQATRDRFKASWERQQGRLTTATTASQRAKLEAKLADEATTIKLAKSMATINEELPKGFGKEFGKSFQARLAGEWSAANKAQFRTSLDEKQAEQLKLIKDSAHRSMFFDDATGEAKKPPTAYDPGKQELVNDAWYSAIDGFEAKRKEAELAATGKASKAEALRQQHLKEDFTVGGEIAAGRFAAAKGFAKTTNPWPDTNSFRSGAWLKGFREENANIASARATAGATYAERFTKEKANVTAMWEPVLEKLWERTHESEKLPADIRSSALNRWEDAKAVVGDLRELQFLQNQYKTAIKVPNAPEEYQPWDKAKADFKTNPKDLELAVRRIYGTHDKEMDRIAKVGVPYEFWSVLGPGGQFKARTWRIKADRLDDMTPEMVDQANRHLRYEASPGNRKRETLAINVEQVERVQDAIRKGKPLNEADRDLIGAPKGPEAPKEPTLGGLPENPEEGVKYTLEQGDDKAEVMIIGGKWFTLKGGKWVPLPR